MRTIVLFGLIYLIQNIKSVEIRTENSAQNYKINGPKLSSSNLENVVSKIRVIKNDGTQINLIEDFPLLTEININFVNQENIPSFKETPLLRSISISGNSVNKVTNKSFSNTNVKSLQLSYNEIVDIQPNSFGKRLESLLLNCNKLKQFDSKWFKKPEKLTFLSIAGNEITYLQNKAFEKFTSLDYLYIGLNKIQQIGSRVFNKKNIADISLYANELIEIKHSSFPITTHIGHLDIQYNKLNYLPSTFLGNLTVDEFYFLGNPWLCPCYNEKIIKWPNWKHFSTWVGANSFKNKSDTPSCVASKNPTDDCVEEVDEEATEYYQKEANLKFVNAEKTCDIWKNQALEDEIKKKFLK